MGPTQAVDITTGRELPHCDTLESHWWQWSAYKTIMVGCSFRIFLLVSILHRPKWLALAAPEYVRGMTEKRCSSSPTAGLSYFEIEHACFRAFSSFYKITDLPAQTRASVQHFSRRRRRRGYQFVFMAHGIWWGLEALVW